MTFERSVLQVRPTEACEQVLMEVRREVKEQRPVSNLTFGMVEVRCHGRPRSVSTAAAAVSSLVKVKFALVAVYLSEA